MRDKRGFLIAIATLLIAITALSTMYTYMEIYVFYLSMKKKVIILEEIDRKSINVADIQFHLLSQTLFDEVKKASRKCLNKKDLVKNIRIEYMKSTTQIWSQKEYEKYLCIENKSLIFKVVGIYIREYKSIEKSNTYRIVDGENIYPRSLCSIMEINFFYNNTEYGVFYEKNETLIACMPLRYLKLYNIGYDIISRLQNKEFSYSTSPRDFVEKYIFSDIEKDGIAAEYSITCVPRKDAYYVCMLDFSLIDIYAKKSGATVYRVKFPRVKFYYEEKTEEG
ncbi:MAG: hypothetical protein DRJ44_02935 [Thermoprotei archaeon]|nr:MAG: hypothetical protein DRJ44_02935 [Thermoprotei archaeon]